jgi:hypothetical protein
MYIGIMGAGILIASVFDRLIFSRYPGNSKIPITVISYMVIMYCSTYFFFVTFISYGLKQLIWMGLNFTADFIAVNNPGIAILDEGFDLVPLFEITETAETITDNVYSFLQSPESMVAELNAMVFGAGILGEWVLKVLSNSLYNVIIGSFRTNIPSFDELYNSAVDVTGRAHSILDILAFFADENGRLTVSSILTTVGWWLDGYISRLAREKQVQTAIVVSAYLSVITMIYFLTLIFRSSKNRHKESR